MSIEKELSKYINHSTNIYFYLKRLFQVMESEESSKNDSVIIDILSEFNNTILERTSSAIKSILDILLSEVYSAVKKNKRSKEARDKLVFLEEIKNIPGNLQLLIERTEILRNPIFENSRSTINRKETVSQELLSNENLKTGII